MGAPAQLHAEVWHGDDPHAVAVFLAEQRHRAGGHRLLGRADLSLDRAIGVDLLVGHPLDLVQLVARERGEVSEVEAQPVRGDQRAGLLDMRAQHPPQGRVQQMSRGVVTARGVAKRLVDLRRDEIPDVEPA